MLRVGVIVAVLCATTAAAAGPRLHAGIDVRTDLRAHPLRMPLGVDLGRLDVTAVLDPLVLVDGQHDADLVVAVPIPCTRWAWTAGWRTSSVSVLDAHAWQQRSLAGVTARVGTWRGLAARFGGDLSILWVKHGAGLPTSWISLDRSIIDRVHLGMYLRVEYGVDL